MNKFGIGVTLVALLVGVAGFSMPSRAETGRVAVVFTKGGFVGVGGGEGVLTLRADPGSSWLDESDSFLAPDREGAPHVDTRLSPPSTAAPSVRIDPLAL